MKPIRVLVVDDDPDDLLLAREMLEEGPSVFSVTYVDSYEGGLSAASNGAFDVCLVDHHLAGYTALDFLAALREAGVSVPSIVLTGARGLETDLEAMEAGAVDYLVKGRTTAETLHRSIRYACRHHHALRLLEAAQERFALVVGGSNDGVWDWNLETDEAFFSDRWAAMLGLDRGDDSTIATWLHAIHAPDLPAVADALRAHAAGETPHVEVEYRVRHRDGSLRWMMARGIGVTDGGRPSRIVGSQTDIDRLKCVEQRLRHALTHDDLTGLPNRTELATEIRRALSEGRGGVALMLVGVDRLRELGMGLGIAATDAILREVAERIRAGVPDSSVVARVGDYEFAVLSTDVGNRKTALARATSLSVSVERPVDVGSIPIQVRCHVGVALGPSAGRGADEVLCSAAVALAVARRRPGGAVSVFREGDRQHTQRSVILEGLLGQALTRGELRLEYQPMVEIPTLSVTSFEALARWRMRDGTEVSPALFIPLAERSGWIRELGQWCLREGCRAIRRFREAGKNVVVSVNVSTHQLQHPDFRADLADAIATAGISPRSLKLELTESVLIEHSDQLLMVLRSVADLGVELVIDDFGTGYSCLAYLPTLPVGGLKIDRTFVRGLPESKDQLAIVTAVATLAKRLGLGVVAEGVERAAQLDVMGRLNCDQAQGWMFSRALPLDDALSLAHFRYGREPEAISSIRAFPNAS